MSRLGSVVNDVAEPHIARTAGLIPAVWTSVAICVAATGCAALLLPLDRAARRWGGAREASAAASSGDSTLHWDTLRTVTTFQRPLWLVIALVVCVYGVVIPFNSVAVPLLCELLLCGGRCCADGVMNCAPPRTACRVPWVGAFLPGAAHPMPPVLSALAWCSPHALPQALHRPLPSRKRATSWQFRTSLERC